MRTLIKKILRETSNNKLKTEFLNMGVEGAKQLGVSPTDYINIVFDGDVISHVSHFLNPLLHLDKSGRWYMYNGDGPLQGGVFEYVVSPGVFKKIGNDYIYNPSNKDIIRTVWIYQKKYDYIMKFMDEGSLTRFLNEYYNLFFHKIVPQKEVNFG
jgi:hypothetical protein